MKSYITLFLIFAMTALFSFINQMIYANYFGASSSFDMLNAVLSLPFAIIGIGVGAISLIIMPILSEAKEKYQDCSATLLSLLKRYYKQIGLFVIIIIVFQTIIFYDKVSPENQRQFIKLSILSGLFLFISFLNSFFIVYFNLKKKFILASINAIVTYMISIVLCLLFAKEIGVDIVIYSFILSNIMLMVLFYYNFLIYNKQSTNNYSLDTKIDSKILLAGIFSIFPFTVPVFIDSYFLLGMSAGSLSYVSYANKIIVMIASILIQPLNLILFPKILENISNYDYIKKILFKIYILTFVGIIIMYVLSKLFFLDFMHIFFEQGEFTSQDSLMVYQVFLIYLIGVFGMVSMNIQNKVITALKMFDVQIYFSLFFIVLYFISMMYLYKRYGYMSSGYAYAICWSLYMFGITIVINNRKKMRIK